ncbi:hypothetical protein BJ508DRAFT_417144 [Ascobolus immersus RN42]|uniref:Golgi apparatus membrane protein TVP38 n=1 Tax=Ascobolus immersus RN42 TaxID=1160509 RepID=A0A3N4HZL9_ASCIM|nr:hypothetical protein BJ508DRAFT_417144 [Ascobolus immersus RN42]
MPSAPARRPLSVDPSQSPLMSPTIQHSGPNPPPRWTRSTSGSRIGALSPGLHRRGRSGSIMSSTSFSQRPKGIRGYVRQAKSQYFRAQKMATKQFNRLNLWQKIGLVMFGTVSLVVGVLALVFHEKLLHSMVPISDKLKSMKAGWMFIWALCFASAFPPLFGYSTSITLAGFVYGFPNGWFIVSTATLVGSTASFITCRYWMRGFATRMVKNDKRFAALSSTLKHDGVKLLCMIRLCPLPYSISNGAISTFPSVSPWSFIFATAIATPKLFIHIFIGSRLAELAELGEKMDAKTKAINYASIIGGIVIGVATGWIIYKRMQTRIRHLEEQERTRLFASSSRGAATYSDSPRTSADLSASTLLAQHLAHSGHRTSEERDVEAQRAARFVTDLIEGDEDAQGLEFRDEDDLTYTDAEDGEGEDLLLEGEVGRGASELGEVQQGSQDGGVGKKDRRD